MTFSFHICGMEYFVCIQQDPGVEGYAVSCASEDFSECYEAPHRLAEAQIVPTLYRRLLGRHSSSRYAETLADILETVAARAVGQSPAGSSKKLQQFAN